MKKLLPILMFSAVTYGQHFEWAVFPEVQMSYNPALVGYSTASDDSGNLYMCGYNGNPFFYNDIMGDVSLSKYDASGNLIFSNNISGHVQTYNLITDQDQNIVATFKFMDEITMGAVTLTSNNDFEQFVLAKFDSSGSLLWYEWLQPEPSQDFSVIGEAKAMCIDSEGNIYIGFSDFMTTYIRKYDTNGNLLQTIAQESVRRVSSLAVDASGNLYAAGSCMDPGSEFAGVPVTEDFLYSMYMVKYDSQGTYQWSKIIEDITCGEPRLAVTPSGATYLSSSFFFDISVEGITLPGGSDGDDFFLVRFEADGTLDWVIQTPTAGSFIPGSRNSMSLDSEENIYLSGQSRGLTDWGNGVVSGAEGIERNGLLLKFGPDGQALASKSLSSSYSHLDSHTLTINGDVIVAGMAFGLSSFDDLNHDPGQQENHYPFMASIAMEALSVNNSISQNIVLSPNPASSTIHLSGLTSAKQVQVFSVSGQLVAEGSLTTDGFDVSRLASGFYILKADDLPAIKFVKK